MKSGFKKSCFDDITDLKYKIKLIDKEYYVDYFNHYIRIIFYHPNYSKLPKYGWIHHCILCGSKTCNIEKYKLIKSKYIFIQSCINCWKNKCFKNDYDNFDKLICNIML